MRPAGPHPGAQARRGRTARGVSMRWWLAAAFASLAALTAFAVSQISVHLVERDFGQRAEELATGRAVRATTDVGAAVDRGTTLAAAIRQAERRWRLTIIVADDDGRIPPAAGAESALAGTTMFDQAVAALGDRRRFVATDPQTGRVYVGLRVDLPEANLLVAIASRSDLATGIDLVRDATRIALIAAIILGLVAGALAAGLITARLRRLRTAAEAIEHGDFEVRLAPGFPDEVGQLGASLQTMSGRLGELFSALESERRRLDRVLRRLHEGVIAIRADGTVSVANPAAERITGSGPLESGDPVPEVLTALIGAAPARAPAGGAAGDALRPLPDGRTLKVVTIPPAEPDDETVVVVEDVTEEVNRERAEREFVGNAAHELRAPLTTISGAVDVLLDGAADDPAARARFLGHLARETSRLGELVRTLLMLARVQTGQERLRTEEVHLAPLLGAVADEVPEVDGRAVRVEVPEELSVPADAGLLGHALRNLAANAAAHTDRGTITLAAGTEDHETVIRVADTGGGIDPADTPHVFDRFYRGAGRSGEGFGLGLPIVRECVGAMGGTVDITSEPGAGTTAVIRLPSVARVPAGEMAGASG